MPINVLWDNEERTIIRFDFIGNWDWNEYWHCVERSLTMLVQVTHPVDTIANLANSAGLPTGSIQQVKRTFDQAHVNLGIIVINQGGMFVRVMASAFARVYRPQAQRIFLSESLENARAIIRAQHDAQD